MNKYVRLLYLDILEFKHENCISSIPTRAEDLRDRLRHMGMENNAMFWEEYAKFIKAMVI